MTKVEQIRFLQTTKVQIRFCKRSLADVSSGLRGEQRLHMRQNTLGAMAPDGQGTTSQHQSSIVSSTFYYTSSQLSKSKDIGFQT